MAAMLISQLAIACCLIALVGAQLNGKCPSGWLNRPNSNWCYQLSDNLANTKSWMDAKKACEIQHGYLLSIADTEERVWLATKINPYVSGDRFWWFGLSRPGGTWMWDDGHTGNEKPGTLGSGTLLYWWSAVSDGTSGNCMTIYQDLGSTSFIRVWPRDCDLKYKYVCKKLKQEVTTCDTDNNWELQNGKCLKVYNHDGLGGVTWDVARSKCNADESDLVSIPDQATNVAVRDMMNRAIGVSRVFWVGLRTYKDTSDPKGYAWRWPDETTLTYEAWNSGSRPDISLDQVGNTCVQTTGSDERKLWKNYACDGEFGYVCSRAVGTCPTGWYQHRDSCYSINVAQLSWDEADTYCRARNASLLQIKQKHIQDFVNDYRDDFAKQGINYIWIGLYRATNKDKLSWTSGGEAIKTYTNWVDGEPKLEDSRPNAIRIVAADDKGRWQAANPVDKGGYVCEIPLGKVPQEPTVPPPRYSCETGWLLYGKSCYKLEIRYADWLTARGNCRNFPGADLIDIRDAAEQEFIQGKLADHDFWIGLHARSNEDRRWMWTVDETAASFFNWNDGEPNNGAGEENCVEMYLFGKWNDIRCTYRLPYICKTPAQIGGTPPTPAPTTSLIWDPFCGPLWSRDLLSNYCYMFITDPMIWVDAKHQCEYQGGKLLSIVTDSEKSYITARMQEVKAANPGIVHFWIGFNDRAVEGRWVWDDNQPVTYLNWAAGEPNNAGDGEDCGIIYPDSAQWNDIPCERRYAGICKKLGNVEPTSKPPATTISVPGGYLRGCRDGYTGYNDMCYKVYGAESDEITHEEAQQKCRMEGGELPSINSAAEHQFLMELAKPFGEFGFWIGFYDSIALQRTMYFQWTDRSQPKYTSWHIGEPNNHGSREDCVELVNMFSNGWNGNWNDLDCTWARKYACKQRQIPVLVTPPVTRPYGCSADFDDAFDGYCLKFESGTAPLTATQAQQRCTSIGGTLATIPSVNVNNHFFLRITQLRATTDFWIGLTRTSNVFRWDDGRFVTYTYWKPGASLVGIRASISAQTAQWQMSANAAVTYTNYICQIRQPGVTTPIPTYNPAYCAPGWVEADETCYKGFSVSQASSRLTWTEARTQCKMLSGDLATVNSEEASTALRQTIGGTSPYWIGLNTRDSNQGFVWADGKPAKFFKWRGNQEPENINGNQNCALLNPGDMAWTIQNCNTAQNWLCETPKGIYPNGTTPEPTTAPDAPDCGSGWKYYNGSCYLFTTRTNDWHKSLTACREQGGDLVSLHNHDENDFIVAQLSKMHISSTSYWIGLNELGQNDGFRWSDGTGANFFNWNTGEPNNWGGAEHCVALYSNNGLWNDDQCGVLFYAICKKNNDTSRTNPPATPMPGKCPAEYYTAGNKCYRVFDSVQVTWNEARDNCEKLADADGIRGYLASISNEYEQAALTTLRARNDSALWIGLYARSYAHQYMWHDNSEVSFTNWDYNEPNNPGEQCVEMYTEKFRAGKWNDAWCTNRRGYVCMTYKNPSLITDWVPPTVVSCKAGWTAYGQACFLFVANAATWKGALATCSTNGGNLASIHDLWEQNHIHFKTETIGRFSTWIGLSDETGTGQYAWSDKWPVTYTNWGRGQPNGGDKPNCVSMDNKGGWITGDCETSLPFMCRQSFGSEPTTIPHLPGTCPSDFVPFGDSCYYVGNNTESKDAQEAQYECSKRYRSTLVSILSQGEQDFVASQIRLKAQDVNQRKDYWIGMLRGSDGGFEWYDFSPVSFLYWSNGEPSNTPNENCVEMYHLNLKWNDHYCTKKNSFVCKMPKLPATGGTTTTATQTATSTSRLPPQTQSSGATAPSTTTQATTKSSGGVRAIADLTNDGLVAGLVILFLVVLVAIVTAMFFYRRHTGPKMTGESGFANANWSKTTDEVNLEGRSGAPRVQIQLDSGVENPSFSS